MNDTTLLENDPAPRLPLPISSEGDAARQEENPPLAPGDSPTLHRLHRHFAELLGCRPEDLACGNRQVVTSDRREDVNAAEPATPLWALRRENGWVVSVTPDAYSPATRLLQALPSHEDPLSEPARRRLHEAVGRVAPVFFHYSGLQLYTDRESFRPFAKHAARRLTPDDLPLLRSARCPLADQEDRIESGDAFAVVKGEEVRSYAFLRRLSPEVWEIVVETAAPYRGRGYGKSVVSAATEAALQAGRIPVYSCDEHNAASRRLAESLGYRTYAEDFVCLGQ
ncbi:MAG: GNAT family N-acetyltransferase [Armatimonadetes bacterium]|nr:GNAT family N-acetyltransferase [Armatimonadota bacterium]